MKTKKLPQSPAGLTGRSGGSKSTLAIVDELLEEIRKFAPGTELKYNEFYIGLANEGQPNNFTVFRATLNVEIRLPPSDEVQKRLEGSGLDVMDYDKRWGRYRIRLTRDDLQHEEVICDLMKMAWQRATS